jgi:succinate dehydrogenase / fumarate reductase cytochrome b subunit
MRTRPLSPHLTVYRPMYTMVLSITHRASGVALSLGLLALSCWLMALASGEAAFDAANALLSRGLFKILLALWLLAFVYHLCNGLRHLAWDAGLGLERTEARRSGVLAVIAALVLFAVIGYFAFSVGGRA